MLSKTGYCDFHCHLDDKCFDKNRWQIIDQCFSRGIANIISVADPFKKMSLEKTEEILAYKPNIYAICGSHPHQADKYSPAIEENILNFQNREKFTFKDYLLK